MGAMPDGPLTPSAAAGADKTVNDNAEVYYGEDYWNNLPVVVARLNEKVSGDPDEYWGAHFGRSAGRVFKRALVLNCGNGNVEQGLLGNGVVTEGIGIDYSDDLLAEARRDAADKGLPLHYHQLDVNTADLPDDEFDLVVNHAAAHHIARIDRVFRELCRRLPDDGVFVSHDYIGPHRNQYPWEAWDAANRLNQELPERLQQEMSYPHLPTMLRMDPTEAIHSELILSTMRRYFTIDELVPLGGAIAYQLLTHNARIFAADPDDPARVAAIDRVVRADDEFTAADPEQTWFAYIVARPNKSVLEDESQLAAWSTEEDEREAAAAANGGEYYDHTTLQQLTLAVEHWESTAHRVQAYSQDVHQTYERIMGLPPYQQIRWFARTPLGDKLRHDPRVKRLLGRGDRALRR